MIRARRLEDWLADWLERNADRGSVLTEAGECSYHGDGTYQDHFSITRLATDLAVALAEESLDRA